MRAFLLTMISCSLILVVLSFGYYRTWFVDKPIFYWNGFMHEVRSSASPEEIRQSRYGLSYTISMKVKQAVEKSGIKDVVLLFEPNTYYRDSLHSALRIPEPAVFYYYTGLRAVAINSPDVGKANCLVRVRQEAVTLQPIGSQQELQTIRSAYRKFPFIL